MPPPPPPPPSYPASGYPFAQGPAPGAFPPSGYGALVLQYAGWGMRVGGFLIDAVIFIVVRVIIAVPLRHSNALVYRHTMVLNNGTVRHTTINFLVLIISGVLFLLYASILIGLRGQTIGMMAVSIRAVSVDGQGQVVPGRAFGRTLLEQVLGLTVVLWILDMLWPLWDAKNQTLHDKAFGTVVIRTRNYG